MRAQTSQKNGLYIFIFRVLARNILLLACACVLICFAFSLLYQRTHTLYIVNGHFLHFPFWRCKCALLLSLYFIFSLFFIKLCWPKMFNVKLATSFVLFCCCHNYTATEVVEHEEKEKKKGCL